MVRGCAHSVCAELFIAAKAAQPFVCACSGSNSFLSGMESDHFYERTFLSRFKSKRDVQMSDGKRGRNGGRPGAPAQGSHHHHALRQKRDPAREAIKNSRDKRMHEVLASMLTTLHTEAWSKEQGDSFSPF